MLNKLMWWPGNPINEKFKGWWKLYLHTSLFLFDQKYEQHSLFNSAKLSCLVDWPWSTTCPWCSFLCNLLVNPWAGEISSLSNISMDPYGFLFSLAPACKSNSFTLSLAALWRSGEEFLNWRVIKPVQPASLGQTFPLVLWQEVLQLLLHVH